MIRMARVPTPVDAWYHDYLFSPAPQQPGAVHESAPQAQRVLYGPTGDVVYREPERQIGFTRDREVKR